MSLRQQIADPSSNIEWRSDDGSTLVSIPSGLVDRIAGYVTEAFKSLPRRGAEAGGLLIGDLRIGRLTEIFVTGFEPVTCDYLYGPSFILSDTSQAEFRAALARHPGGEILGYYRSHTRAGFGLETSDREIVTRVFPGLSGLILLIKPASALSLKGSYFFFQRGSIEMRPVGPEFAFAGSIPGGAPPPSRPEPEPRPPVQAAPPRSTQRLIQESLELAPDITKLPPREEPSAADVETPATTKRRKSLQWEIVAAGCMIAAAFALLWWQYRGDSGEGDRGFPPLLPGMGASSHSAAATVASLGLAVQPGEGGWRITWDPNSPAAHDAVRGVLNVADSDSHERIPLDVQQIREGSATYRPVSDDVAFRLELVRPDSSLSSETYRVLVKPAETASAAPPVVKRSAMPAPAMPASPKQPLAQEKPAEKPPEIPAERPGSEGYVEPEVVSKVAPEVPEGIRPRITAPQPIDVRVSINREGRVTSATPLQRGDGLINYLGDRAVAAARQWSFSPARQDGKPVPSSRTIHFVFEQ